MEKIAEQWIFSEILPGTAGYPCTDRVSLPCFSPAKMMMMVVEAQDSGGRKGPMRCYAKIPRDDVP